MFYFISGILYVDFIPKQQAFNAGDVLAELKGLTSGTKAYTSVQCGRDQHFELNSDLVYSESSFTPEHPQPLTPSVNHSCEPNVAFDMSSPDPKKWHLRALKQIKAGDPCKKCSRDKAK